MTSEAIAIENIKQKYLVPTANAQTKKFVKSVRKLIRGTEYFNYADDFEISVRPDLYSIDLVRA